MLTLSRRFALQATIGAAFAAVPLSRALSQPSSSTADAFSIMNSDPKFSDWVQILKFTGLAQYAASNQKFTAFIPTNAAFQKYPAVLWNLKLSRSKAFPDTTSQVMFVRSHVVLDIHPLSELGGKAATLTSIAGTPIMIDVPKPGVYDVTWVSINSQTASTRIISAPIMASNAIIYPFDDVTLVMA
jgi:uncharacterized surface protein with fasciclin (FAS1) repeats